MRPNNHSEYLNFNLIWQVFGIFLIAVVIFLSLTSNPPIPMTFSYSDKVGHVLAYSALMAWYSQLFMSRKQQIVLAIAFSLMGMGMEILQALGGHRMFQYGDMLANTMGVVIGWWISRVWFSGLLMRIDRWVAGVFQS